LSKIEFVEWEPLWNFIRGKKKRTHADGGCDDDDGEDSDGDDDMGGGGTGAAAGGASSRGDRRSNKTYEKLKSLFSEKMHDIQNYLNELKKQVEYYHDAASGEKMRVEKDSIALETVPSKSTASRLEADPKALQQDMICPINHSLMLDPVRCFAGATFRTYERSAIEAYFKKQIALQEQDKRANVLDPVSRLELQIKQVDGKYELVLEQDNNMRQRIADFQQEVSESEERKKNEAEGDEERRMLLRRLGYDPFNAEEKRGEVISCAAELSRGLVKGDFLCVIGPPAIGKTITMLLEISLESSFRCSPPRLPIFIRAAELEQILAAISSQAFVVHPRASLFS